MAVIRAAMLVGFGLDFRRYMGETPPPPNILRIHDATLPSITPNPAFTEIGSRPHSVWTDRAGWNNIVIIMRALHVSIRQIGNSHGVVIPKPLLAQLGLNSEDGAEMSVEDGALVLRRPANPPRTGWADAARKIAKAADDALVMGEFGNVDDADLLW